MGIQNEKGYHTLYALKFLMIFLSFSDFLAHLSRRLKVSFVTSLCPVSVVRKLFFKQHLLNCWPKFKIISHKCSS